MALKSTIYKADLSIADMDRGYYEDHQLTIAQHPSENDERMMLRILAFALHANEQLSLTKGLSDVDEPDIWQKDLTDALILWIELGQPDERRLLKAMSRSQQVAVYCSVDATSRWWTQLDNRIHRAKNLTVRYVAQSTTRELAALAQRTMKLQCTIQDGQAWISNGDTSVEVHWANIKEAAAQ